jgi:hypothetical protein
MRKPIGRKKAMNGCLPLCYKKGQRGTLASSTRTLSDSPYTMANPSDKTSQHASTSASAASHSPPLATDSHDRAASAELGNESAAVPAEMQQRLANIMQQLVTRGGMSTSEATAALHNFRFTPLEDRLDADKHRGSSSK